MPEYLSPAVYIEERPGAKPIEGVGTSTGAFLGIAEKGPIGEPKLITNMTQFTNTFGKSIPEGYLADAVTQFFVEGGTKCYCVRTAHYSDATTGALDTAAAASAPQFAAGAETLDVAAVSPGTWGEKISLVITHDPDNADMFSLIVYYDGVEVETFAGVTMDTVESAINNTSKYIVVDSSGFTAGARPDASPGDPPTPTDFTAGSGNDGLTNLDKNDFMGSEAGKTGLHAFDTVDDINIVAIPDCVHFDADTDHKDIVIAGLNYCGIQRKDCFFVADPPEGLDPQGIATWMSGLNSAYAALYYPWIKPLIGDKKLTPPSGAIAGTYSATDVARGVHKAPAGTLDGYLNAATAVERVITKGEHDTLNPIGINVIRSFPVAGLVVWGARTISNDAEWKYVNVRRLFLFLEESIEQATQYVVFEPNSPALWGTVKRDITNFLTVVWRSGALFGLTPDEAFFVKIDSENNPPESRDLGRLIIDVGVAPVKPAEFVIIRFSQKTLEA